MCLDAVEMAVECNRRFRFPDCSRASSPRPFRKRRRLVLDRLTNSNSAEQASTCRTCSNNSRREQERALPFTIHHTQTEPCYIQVST